MINIWLMGGFGNILFQLFVAYLLRKEGNEVKLSSTLTQKNLYTKALKWTIHDPVYTKLISSEHHANLNIFPFFFLLISKNLNIGKRYSFFYKGSQSPINYKSQNIFGYFQSTEFIDQHNVEFRSFTKSIASKLAVLFPNPKKPKACIHIRLGDSKWAKENISYYKKSLEHIPSNLELMVVTDSIDEAKLILSDRDAIYTSNDDALIDFQMLLSAEFIICAPSTFSWWAAQCSSNPRVIIMPKSLFDKLSNYSNEKKLIII